jgi:hypothetical protein
LAAAAAVADLDLVTLLGEALMVGAGDLLFRAAARSDRLFVVPVGALMLVDESREERPEEELEPAPEPEVPLAVFLVGSLAALAAAFFASATFFASAAFLAAAALVFFALSAAASFLVTPAAVVRGPGAFFVAGGAGGALAWIYGREVNQRVSPSALSKDRKKQSIYFSKSDALSLGEWISRSAKHNERGR